MLSITKPKRDPILIASAQANVLRDAWKRVRGSGGGPGIDGQTLADFDSDSETQMTKLAIDMERGGYRFTRLRSAVVPKENGKQRKLGIPTVRDRVVLQAIRLVLQPQCERAMHDSSHAYRPGRGAMTALDDISRAMSGGLSAVLETDIEAFFDNIDHRQLLADLRVMEPRAMESEIVREALRLSSGRWHARRGVAQGSPLSPLLANVALTSFDFAIAGRQRVAVRYADDLVVLCRDLAAAQQAMRDVQQQLSKLGLTMHPEKTRLVDSRAETFGFLGFEFHPDRLVPDAENLAKLRDSIAACCNPHRGDPWERRLAEINSLLRSFTWYYHRTDATRLFWGLDQYVEQLLQELEVEIGPPSRPWQETLVKTSRMRRVGWKGSSKRGRKGWDGY
jgi:group II intron reverse transcriptase/maturase